MSKAGILVILGLIVIALPLLGIPTSAKTFLCILLGVAIVALAILLREERRHLMRALSGEHTTDAYTENSAHAYAAPQKTEAP